MHCRHNTICAVDMILYPQLGCFYGKIQIVSLLWKWPLAMKRKLLIPIELRKLTLKLREKYEYGKYRIKCDFYKIYVLHTDDINPHTSPKYSLTLLHLQLIRMNLKLNYNRSLHFYLLIKKISQYSKSRAPSIS